MSIAASIHALMSLLLFGSLVYGVRWVWHRYFGAPLNPDGERERLRQAVAQSFRLAKRITKWYFPHHK